MAQETTTTEPQMTQGQSAKGPHPQNVQLGAASELKNWDKKIGPRSLAAAERCRKQPEAKQQE
jgi:hypothetical protein